MAAKIVGGENQEEIAGKVYYENEQAVLSEGIALEVSENDPFDQQGDHKGDWQPDQWIALEQDQQYAVNDARNQVHDEGDFHARAGGIPAEQGEGDAFDEAEEKIDHEYSEEAEDQQHDRGGGSGDGEEKGGGHRG